MCSNVPMGTYNPSTDSFEPKEVWIKAKLVSVERCGIAVVSIHQNGHLFKIGVDKGDLHNLVETARMEKMK